MNEAVEKLVVNCVGPDEVVVNVQPGDWPNRVLLGSRELNVAVLTTAAGEHGRAEPFDAPSILEEAIRIGTRRMGDGSEPGSTTFAGMSVDDTFEPGPPETVQDGDPDLVVQMIDA